MNDLLAALDWRSLAVLRRNALVYFRNWKTAFFPPAMEPIVFFIALGFGLAGYMQTIEYEGQSLDYPTYIAPGLVAYAAFGTSWEHVPWFLLSAGTALLLFQMVAIRLTRRRLLS